MAELPILIVAYFFGAVTFLASHALIVVPIMIAAWLLMFVPDSAWAKLRRSVSTTGSLHSRAVAPRRSVDAAETTRPRELAHSR